MTKTTVQKIVFVFFSFVFTLAISCDNDLFFTIFFGGISAFSLYELFHNATEKEIREFTFCNWFQKKFGIDLLSEE